MSIALSAGAAPVKAAVVAAAPKDKGHLAAATIIKVKKASKNPDVWYAVVGASTKYKRAKKKKGKNGRSQIVKKTDRKTGKKVNAYIKPGLYQYFVDRGTRNMRARHYLTAAFKRAKSQFQARTLRKLHEVLAQMTGRK